MAENLPRLAGLLTGILLAVSAYIRVAAGSGMVPDVAVNYSLYLTLLCMLISWFTFDVGSRYSIKSLVIGIFFCIFYVVAIFLTGFVIGLPGGEFITLNEIEILLDAPIILGVIILFRQFKLFPIIVTGFLGGFVLIVLSVHAITDAFVGVSIQRIIRNGGYVIACSYNGLDRRRVMSTSDVSYGLIVGHRSDRIVFVSNSSPMEWRYGKFMSTPTYGYTCPPNGYPYRSRSRRFDE